MRNTLSTRVRSMRPLYRSACRVASFPLPRLPTAAERCYNAPVLRLKKTDWIFVVVVGAVIGTLVVLPFMRKRANPVSPGVAEHAAVTADSPRDTCLPCHAPDSG